MLDKIIELLQTWQIVIGLIIICPITFRLFEALTFWITSKFGNPKKDLIIKHYHNGELISTTTIKLDPNEPIVVKNIAQSEGNLNG